MSPFWELIYTGKKERQNAVCQEPTPARGEREEKDGTTER